MSDYYLEDALGVVAKSRLDTKTKHKLLNFIFEEDIESAYNMVQGIVSDMLWLETYLEYSRDEPQWKDRFNIDFREILDKGEGGTNG